MFYSENCEKSFSKKCTGSFVFGFNGKEKDDEWNGTSGVSYDYGFRIYDPRIGRFLSVDPLSKSYPFYSPYQFAANTPVFAIDLDGLEARISVFGAGVKIDDFTGKVLETHESLFKKESDNQVAWNVADNSYAAHTTVQLINVLKSENKKNKDQGGIEYLAINSHGNEAGAILDNGQYGQQMLAVNECFWNYSMVKVDDIEIGRAHV